MNHFNYYRPDSVKEIIELLEANKEKNTFILCGGTDLIPRLKAKLISPQVLIDITNVEELKGVRIENGKIIIGAVTTFAEILESELCKKYLPVLIEAAQQFGSPQIRNRTTIGGNIVNASPAGDSIPPLYVLEASLVLVSSDGQREEKIESFFLGPGMTIKKPDELLTHIIIPTSEQAERGTFLKLGQRRANAISKVSMALQIEINNTRVMRKVKIAFGAVAPTVVRARKIEQLLSGQRLTEERVQKAMEMAQKEVQPITDIRSTEDYRRKMAAVLLKRGLLKLTGEL